MFEDSVSEDKCGIIIYEGKGAFYFSVFACFLFAEVDMVTLNDYLYSGDTVLRIIQKYSKALKESSIEKSGVAERKYH